MSDAVLPKDQFFLIKAATRDLIAAAGGLERAASTCGRSKSTVQRWGAPGEPDLIPLDCALILEADTGTEPVTGAMAAIHKLALTPRTTETPAGNWNRAFAGAAAAGARVISAVAEAQADGVISPNEQNDIARAIAADREALDDLAGQIAAAHGAAIKVAGA